MNVLYYPCFVAFRAPWKLAQPLLLWATARAMDSMQGVAPCPLLTDKSHVNERCDIIPYSKLRSHILDLLRGFVAYAYCCSLSH